MERGKLRGIGCMSLKSGIDLALIKSKPQRTRTSKANVSVPRLARRVALVEHGDDASF